jgi:NAD-dependent DNA ligase
MTQRTPPWMAALIALLTLCMVIAMGFWLHFYAKQNQMLNEWHLKDAERKRVEASLIPIQNDLTLLADSITIAQDQVTKINTVMKDEQSSVQSLLVQSDKHLANISSSIGKVKAERRELLQKLEETRQEWAREEDLQLSNAADHENSLGDLLLKVKEMQRELELEQKNARLVENDLQREIERLERRVQELMNQKEIDQSLLRKDGSIVAARTDLGFVVIDLGWQNNLRPGTRFDVFTTRAGSQVVKGTIEVTEVDDRIAHGRIVEVLDDKDPIIDGDQLHNPIYDPDQTKVFVIKGVFHEFSPEELARFIRDAGGIVDNNMSSRTHFLVAGDNSDEAVRQASDYGVVILSERKLIEFVRMPHQRGNEEGYQE